MASGQRGQIGLNAMKIARGLNQGLDFVTTKHQSAVESSVLQEKENWSKLK
jgi:hypothetical protein